MATTQKWQIVATLEEFGDWEQNSGGEIDAAVTDHVPAGERSPRKLTGTISYTDITLMRAYDPNRDEQVIDWVRRFFQGRERPRACTVQYRNGQNIVVKSRTYGICIPKSVSPPDGQAGQNTPADIKLVLAVESLL